MIEAQIQQQADQTIRLSEQLDATGYTVINTPTDGTYLLGHFHREGAYVVEAAVRFQPTLRERFDLWRAGVPLNASMISYVATPDPDSTAVKAEVYYWPKDNTEQTGKTIPLSKIPRAGQLVQRLNNDLSDLLNQSAVA